MTTYALRYNARPWTLNVERQGNRFQRAALVREWRAAFALLARHAHVPPLAAVEVTVTPHVRNRRSLPDTGACFGAAKASIDGLVDAGVLTDDGPDVVRRLTFLAPVVDGADALVLSVLACEAVAA